MKRRRNKVGVPRLAYELGVSEANLRAVAKAAKELYVIRSIPKKRDGQTVLKGGIVQRRKLSLPRASLRRIQVRILNRYLRHIPFSDAAHGGVRKRSNITNALVHQGKKYFFLTDIVAFYPSIKHRRVYALFCDLGFQPDAARILTLLTTHSGGLPQGVCTSSHLANLVCKPLDNALLSYCGKRGITYSRLVDDLTFSSAEPIGNVVGEIIHIVTAHGLKPNRKKTVCKVGPVDVTGASVRNNDLVPTQSLIQRLNEREPGTRSHASTVSYIKRVCDARRK